MTPQTAARACLTALTFFVGTTLAEAQNAQELVALFNNCKPVGVRVARLNADATEAGLIHERLQAVVESRLTAARLYGGDAGASPVFPSLYVDVTVLDSFYSVRLLLRKIMCSKDLALTLCVPTTSWEEGMLGVHGGDADRILFSVSERLDSFLVEYLRVNEEACSN